MSDNLNNQEVVNEVTTPVDPWEGFEPIESLNEENLKELIVCANFHEMEGKGFKGIYREYPKTDKVPAISYCEVDGVIKPFVLQNDLNELLLDATSLVEPTTEEVEPTTEEVEPTTEP